MIFLVQLFLLLLTFVSEARHDRVQLEYNNGSLNIITGNGTVMVDQLDLKQAIANLQTMNANLSSELSANTVVKKYLNLTVQELQTAQEASRSALNLYFPERYFAGPQRAISTTIDAFTVQQTWTMTVTWMC
jgi:hypothetical protein